MKLIKSAAGTRIALFHSEPLKTSQTTGSSRSARTPETCSAFTARSSPSTPAVLRAATLVRMATSSSTDAMSSSSTSRLVAIGIPYSDSRGIEGAAPNSSGSAAKPRNLSTPRPRDNPHRAIAMGNPNRLSTRFPHQTGSGSACTAPTPSRPAPTVTRATARIQWRADRDHTDPALAIRYNCRLFASQHRSLSCS